MKLLATSDLHLGRHSSLPFDESDDTLTASAHTWHRIVDYAIREEMDVLVMAGDLVDEANRYYEAVFELEKGIKRLTDAGIPVVMGSGNHDYNVLPEMIDRNPGDIVHLLGRSGKWETRIIAGRNGEKLRVTGWSFPEDQPRFSRNPMETFEKNGDDTLPSVGLLHCDVDQPGSAYAPVATADFDNTGLDYWILGHIHKPGVIRNRHPEVFYPGAPHPFDAGEPDAGYVHVIDTGEQTLSTQAVSLTPVRYNNLVFDVPDVDEVRLRSLFLDKLKDVAAEPGIRSDELRLLVLTVHCRGTLAALQRFGEAHQDRVNEYLPIDENLKAVVRKWIEMPRAEVDLKRLAGKTDPVGLLASWLIQIEEGGYSPELQQLLSDSNEAYRNLAAHRVFEPLGKSTDPDDDTVRDLFYNQGMKLLQTLLQQVEER